MTPTTRVVVRDLAEAEAALKAGAAILESPPGAGRYWGAPYFLALVAAAQAAMPDATFEAILDCGDSPGLAVEALRQGVRAVRVAGDARVVAAVADIAAQLGARVETAPRPDGASS